MEEARLVSDGFRLVAKKACKRKGLLGEMHLAIPRRELLSLLLPCQLEVRISPPPLVHHKVTLGIHLPQQFFDRSVSALQNIWLFRELAHLEANITQLPDESFILRLRAWLEARGVVSRVPTTVVYAKLIERVLVCVSGRATTGVHDIAPAHHVDSHRANGLWRRVMVHSLHELAPATRSQKFLLQPTGANRTKINCQFHSTNSNRGTPISTSPGGRPHRERESNVSAFIEFLKMLHFEFKLILEIIQQLNVARTRDSY